MVSVHLGPSWFFGVDAGLEAFASLIAFLVTVASLRLHRITGERRYATFTTSFVLLTLSFLVRAITDFLLEELIWHLPTTLSSKIFFFGYVSHIFLALAGYLILFGVMHKIRDARIMALIGLILIPAMLVSGSYFISFYVLSLIFLVFISVAYFRNYRKVCTWPSCTVFLAFAILTLAQVFFLLETLGPMWYVAAHLAQAAGYLTLLLSLLSIRFKHRKK